MGIATFGATNFLNVDPLDLPAHAGVPLPDPVLLDSAPVDLAEPPETPTVVRNVNGRLTAITPASEDPAQP